MKATLTFQLPEEREEHEAAIHAMDYRIAIRALDERLRHAAKHGLDSRVEFTPALARQWLGDELANAGVAGHFG